MHTRRSFFALTGTLSVCFIVGTVARSAPPLPPMLGAVLVGRDAYVVQPPEMIASGNVTKHHVSTNGVYVLIVRRTQPHLPTSLPQKASYEPAEVTLSFWDTVTHRGGVLWRGVSTEQQPLSLGVDGFFTNSSLALIRIGRGADEKPAESQSDFLLVNVANRTVRLITTGTLDESLMVSRVQPRAALFSNDNKTMRFITPEGTISETYPLRLPGWNSSFVFWFWQKDGKNLLGQYLVKDEKGQPKPARIQMDSQTGKITPYTGALEGEPDALALRPPLPFQIQTDKGEVKRGDATVTLTPLWLEGTEHGAEGRVLITPNALDPELLSRAVLYYSEGALYAAPIQRMDRKIYVTLRRQQYKAQTIDNALKIGRALTQYAYENGGNLPSPESDLPKALALYLKDNAVWNNLETGKLGFQIAYKQTYLSGFSELSMVLLAYLSGPGGRAVIYGDGQVRWEDSS